MDFRKYTGDKDLRIPPLWDVFLSLGTSNLTYFPVKRPTRWRYVRLTSIQARSVCRKRHNPKGWTLGASV